MISGGAELLNATDDLYNIIVTCVIHTSSTADECSVVAIDSTNKINIAGKNKAFQKYIKNGTYVQFPLMCVGFYVIIKDTC